VLLFFAVLLGELCDQTVRIVGRCAVGHQFDV